MNIYNKLNLPKHVIQHSPDGFAWGYGGSGPAELARCLLLEVMGQDHGDKWHYQDFKDEFVAKWDDGWAISDVDIKQWVKLQELSREEKYLELIKIHARNMVKELELEIKRKKEVDTATWTARITYA